MAGWAFSAALAIGAVALLASFHFIRDFVPIGLALTTTALGTLLPILHDTEMLGGRFGRNVLAGGAVGELFPIIAISLFLTRRQQYIAVASGVPGPAACGAGPAAALVGAGVLSVLIFPSAAAALHMRARPAPPAGRPDKVELTGPAGSTRPRNL